jgi:hypothetical protein
MTQILRPFFVTLETTAVVMAENADQAYRVADRERRDICSDEEMSICVGSEVTCEDDLKIYDWDGMCVPYGGDGRTRLKDILAALEALPERDTKTIDMFEETKA